MATVRTARSPYPSALAEAFDALAPEVRRAHLAPLVATGTLDVAHGSHWMTPVLVNLLKLPAAGVAQRVRLEVTAHGDELLWARRIGAVLLRTRQRAVGSQIVERAGLGTIVFDLAAESGALVYRQSALRVAGLPLPRCVAPRVSAQVSQARGGWYVNVHVAWRAHLVCRYSGRIALA